MATVSDPAPAKKSRNSRKALKQKNEIVESPLLSPVSAKAKGKEAKSFEKDLMEMQAMLEKMKIEKEKTEDLLKEKDEILRKKEEEQEKLKVELKKLQKMKEFKPNMSFAFSQSSTQTEEEKKGKKKKKDCAVQEAEQDNKKKAKKIKDPLKPKQPISAYLIYANERRAALREDNKSVIEVAKMTGEEWKNLSEEQKAPYDKMAKKNKEIYLQEMEEYKRTKEEEAMSQKKEEEELMKLHKQEALQLLKKKEKTDNIIKKEKEITKNKKKNENVDPNKPKKPASSFFLFCKDARKSLSEEHPGINYSTLTAHISLKWKELGEEEKQVYNGKAAELMEAYKKEVEEYNKTKTTSS